MSKYHLKLYVTGRTPQSNRAVKNLRALCATELKDRAEVDIIDVAEDPFAAESAHIIATPTLIKTLPPPLRRIVGDLSNVNRVLLGLDILPEDLLKHAESAANLTGPTGGAMS
ncbi:circadian clock KaiB family protein [Rhabdochromatium marinum]|uniref:circadian clock KaiB family protein n=1 Tax=Rhabdochromatium marinum TaxID=48729 RepID=UPI001F5B274F|nr:circadian clock KaiB family protein [Rhabdochromatium marinum]MBK1650063.1 circadian clock protein KaiB [Rhabdochromatium marinum]